MPCWTISTFTVDLDKIDPANLRGSNGFEGLTVQQTRNGLYVSDASGAYCVIQDGQTGVQVIAQNETDANTLAAKLRRAHATAVVEKAAKRFGMKVQKSTFNAGTRVRTLKISGG